MFLNVTYHGWETKKNFHSRSSKMALIGIVFPFLFYWKTSDLHLVPLYYTKKRIVLNNCVKNHSKMFLIVSCRIPHRHRKRSSLLLQKLYKSNFYLYQQSGLLIYLRSVSHVKYSILRKRRFHWCSLTPSDN